MKEVVKERAARSHTGNSNESSLAPDDATPVREFGFTRRAFLGAAAAAGAIAATGLPPRQADAAKGGGGGTTARYPLYVPPVIATPSSYTLTAAPANVSFGTNRGNALAYNYPGGSAGFPGPTFVASRGSSVSVDFVNGLAQESTVHWHGMIVAPGQDGQPQDVVAANGGTRTYAFPINQRACLNWYHPHPHMLTGEQVCLGLAGAFIVRDAEETALGLPAGKYEVPLIIRDANFDKAGNLIYNPRTSGFSGGTPLVNGTRNPTLAVDRGLYRFRVLNGANARLFRLAMVTAGLSYPVSLIGTDGGLLAATVQVQEIEIGPGERLDLLFNFWSWQPGTRFMLRDLNQGWDLLEFVVGTDTAQDTILLPSPLSIVTPLVGPATPTRTFSFDGMSKINGREFDMDRIDFFVPPNTTERWRFTTSGNAPHPVHVHGASFQVVARSGGRGQLYPWERGWKDTVLLQDNETVDVLIRFDGGFAGRYVMHCHKLEHEDMGMMANFVVQ